MTNLYTKKDAYFSFGLATFVYIATQLILGSVITLVPTGGVLYCIFYALLSVVLFGVAFLCAKIARKRFFVVTTAKVKPNLIHALWGCLVTFGLIHLMLPINELLLDFFEWCGLTRPSVDFNLPPVALFVITVLLAPVAEEFLFRGTIGQGLVSQQKPLGGILLSGALFALFHLNPAQTLHQFVLGSFLMLLAYRSGSVWTSVIVHAFNNLAVLVLSYTVEPTGFYQNNMLLMGIVGGVIFIGGVLGYFFTTKQRQQSTAESSHSPQGSPNAMFTTNTIFYLAIATCIFLWVANLLGE